MLTAGVGIGTYADYGPTEEGDTSPCVFCGKHRRRHHMVSGEGQYACRKCAPLYGFPRRVPSTVPEVIVVELNPGSYQFYFFIDWGELGVFWLRRYTCDMQDWNRHEVREVYRDHPGVWIAHASNEFGHMPKCWRAAGTIL